MGIVIYRAIILIPLLIFLVGIFIWIPWMLLRGALQTLIGRPVGFGWQRIEAEVRAAELPDNLPETQMKLPAFHYAVYEVDGEEYKTPLSLRHPIESIRLYVKTDDPQVTWQPQYPDRLTALVGFLFIAGLWGGLIYAGFVIADMIRN